VTLRKITSAKKTPTRKSDRKKTLQKILSKNVLAIGEQLNLATVKKNIRTKIGRFGAGSGKKRKGKIKKKVTEIVNVVKKGNQGWLFRQGP